MEEISLYRKYRPHNFENLIGQDHIKTTLVNAFTTEKVSHAYLFAGPRGTGKTSTARLVAKALNCTDIKDHYEPCNKCEFCVDINDNRLIDLIEIDAASNRGIDEIRDLKEKIGFAPTRSNYKVYIIDEVHMMTKEAFNALLKTLEEPPSHAYFILATTEVHKIPETIISRCQRFDFKRISNDALLARLLYIAKKEGISADEEALKIIAKYVNGGMRDAIGLLEQLTIDKKLKLAHVQDILGVSSVSLLNELYETLLKNETAKSLNIIHELHNQGSDFRQFVHEFVDLLRGEMLAAAEKNDKPLVGKLIGMINVLQNAQSKVDLDIPQLPLEIAVIKITGGCEIVAKPEVPVTPVAKKVETVAAAPQKVAHMAAKPAAAATTKSETVPTAKPVVQKVESSEDSDESNLILSLEQLSEKWPRITERIKKPSLKMSLKSGTLIEVENSNITMQFGTQFHREKVMEHDNRVELEKVIEGFFNTPVKLSALVKEIEIKPVIDEEPVYEESAPIPTPPPAAQKPDLTKQALEIFGGELT